VKDIYSKSLDKIDELCAPYADVIDIDRTSLHPKMWFRNGIVQNLQILSGMSRETNHNNPNMRQLIHVAYKLAALKMDEYF